MDDTWEVSSPHPHTTRHVSSIPSIESSNNRSAQRPIPTLASSSMDTGWLGFRRCSSRWSASESSMYHASIAMAGAWGGVLRCCVMMRMERRRINQLALIENRIDPDPGAGSCCASPDWIQTMHPWGQAARQAPASLPRHNTQPTKTSELPQLLSSGPAVPLRAATRDDDSGPSPCSPSKGVPVGVVPGRPCPTHTRPLECFGTHAHARTASVSLIHCLVKSSWVKNPFSIKQRFQNRGRRRPCDSLGTRGAAFG